jgi:hypothetical protein
LLSWCPGLSRSLSILIRSSCLRRGGGLLNITATAYVATEPCAVDGLASRVQANKKRLAPTFVTSFTTHIRFNLKRVQGVAEVRVEPQHEEHAVGHDDAMLAVAAIVHCRRRNDGVSLARRENGRALSWGTHPACPCPSREYESSQTCACTAPCTAAPCAEPPAHAQTQAT